jgi:hypothetical protein
MSQVFLIISLMMTFNLFAKTTSQQVQFKCQGQKQLCDSCKKDYFNFHILQSATILNGELKDKDIQIQSRGFLEKAGTFTKVRLNTDFILYQNSKYELAVPHTEQSKGLWVKKKEYKNVMLGPNEGPQYKWVQLCN